MWYCVVVMLFVCGRVSVKVLGTTGGRKENVLLQRVRGGGGGEREREREREVQLV